MDTRNNSLFDIKLNDSITVDLLLYDVVCVVECTDGTTTWKEYELAGQYGTQWLRVFKNNGLKVSIHRTIVNYKNINNEKIVYKNEEYTLNYNEKQKIINVYGITDMKREEEFEIYKYINDTGKTVNIEIWEDEVKASIGEYIDETKVVIQQDQEGRYYRKNTDEVKTEEMMETNYERKKGNGMQKIAAWLSWGVVFIPLIIGMIFNLNIGLTIDSKATKENIEAFLKQQGTFTYETSITNKYDPSIKVNVFGTKASIDDTTKLIIGEFSSTIHVKTDEDNMRASILYDKASVLIYTRDDERTLVQVASIKFADNDSKTEKFKE